MDVKYLIERMQKTKITETDKELNEKWINKIKQDKINSEKQHILRQTNKKQRRKECIAEQ